MTITIAYSLIMACYIAEAVQCRKKHKSNLYELALKATLVPSYGLLALTSHLH